LRELKKENPMIKSQDTYENVLEGLRKLDPSDRKKAFSVIKKEREEELKQLREESVVKPNSDFSKAHLLRRIQNPSIEAYEQKIFIPEFTFIGVMNQPDFGEMLFTFYPSKWTIELKSLKLYKDAFREAPISYERLANVIFEDIIQVYEPTRLRLMMRLRPRGGISSCLTIDSDWVIRGGKEQFSDWTNNTDIFGFDSSGASKLQ
jgi:7-cyano-7-deazaguanine reductase